MKKIQDNNNIVISFIICYNSNKLDLYLFNKNNTVSFSLLFIYFILFLPNYYNFIFFFYFYIIP
jgi:hypothetical protein